MKVTEQIKNIVEFLSLIVYLIGVIGGIGYMVYYEEYPIAIGIAVVGILAFPKVKEIFKKHMID